MECWSTVKHTSAQQKPLLSLAGPAGVQTLVMVHRPVCHHNRLYLAMPLSGEDLGASIQVRGHQRVSTCVSEPRSARETGGREEGWGGGHRFIGKGGGGGTPLQAARPMPGTVFPERQVPASMAFVTDSNRPEPLWQPPPTAYPTASGSTFEVSSLLMQPWWGGILAEYADWYFGGGGDAFSRFTRKLRQRWWSGNASFCRRNCHPFWHVTLVSSIVHIAQNRRDRRTRKRPWRVAPIRPHGPRHRPDQGIAGHKGPLPFDPQTLRTCPAGVAHLFAPVVLCVIVALDDVLVALSGIVTHIDPFARPI